MQKRRSSPGSPTHKRRTPARELTFGGLDLTLRTADAFNLAKRPEIQDGPLGGRNKYGGGIQSDVF